MYRCVDQPTLVAALSGKNVVYVACGNAYSAAITEEGALYTWGKGSCGRLGHGKGEGKGCAQEEVPFTGKMVEKVLGSKVWPLGVNIHPQNHTCIQTTLFAKFTQICIN